MKKSTAEARVEIYGWHPSGAFFFNAAKQIWAYSTEDALKKTPEYKGYLDSGLAYPWSKPTMGYSPWAEIKIPTVEAAHKFMEEKFPNYMAAQMKQNYLEGRFELERMEDDGCPTFD